MNDKEKTKKLWKKLFQNKEEYTLGIWPFTKSKLKKQKEWEKK